MLSENNLNIVFKGKDIKSFKTSLVKYGLVLSTEEFELSPFNLKETMDNHNLIIIHSKVKGENKYVSDYYTKDLKKGVRYVTESLESFIKAIDLTNEMYGSLYNRKDLNNKDYSKLLLSSITNDTLDDRVLKTIDSLDNRISEFLKENFIFEFIEGHSNFKDLYAQRETFIHDYVNDLFSMDLFKNISEKIKKIDILYNKKFRDLSVEERNLISESEHLPSLEAYKSVTRNVRHTINFKSIFVDCEIRKDILSKRLPSTFFKNYERVDTKRFIFDLVERKNMFYGIDSEDITHDTIIERFNGMLDYLK